MLHFESQRFGIIWKWNSASDIDFIPSLPAPKPHCYRNIISILYHYYINIISILCQYYISIISILCHYYITIMSILYQYYINMPNCNLHPNSNPNPNPNSNSRLNLGVFKHHDVPTNLGVLVSERYTRGRQLDWTRWVWFPVAFSYKNNFRTIETEMIKVEHNGQRSAAGTSQTSVSSDTRMHVFLMSQATCSLHCTTVWL